MTSTLPNPAISGTQTIQRAAVMLRLLAAHNRTGLRLVDLYKGANLERPTAHRILQGLIAEHLAAQHTVTKRYFLGSGIYEMGLAAAPRFQLRDMCHSYLNALAEKTGDTVFLVARSGFNGVCLDRIEGSFPIRVFVMEVGRPRPLNIGGANISMMSTLPDDEIERICTVNQARVEADYPNYTREAFWKRIADVRANGFLLNQILEAPTARSVAAPIRRSPQGPAVAAISISAVASRFEGQRVREKADLLLEAVGRIEENIAAMGG
jgi:DNA-binding IclR family transcriptional regulator